MDNLTHNQNQMIYWIKERNNIRIRKEGNSPKPWTDNVIMQETYFCNVNREDDKVTKWIRENWTYNFCPEYYDLAMIVARIFNQPSTLEKIGQPNSKRWLEKATPILRDIQANGEKIWNGAYIVSTNGRSIDKLTHYLEIFRAVIKNPDITLGDKTLQVAHASLMCVYGLASFMAAQVVADLKNSKGHPLQNAPDWWNWSSFGPGSLRGLSWFWEEKITKKNYSEKILEAYKLIHEYLPDDVLEILCMQNLQNACCEFDKFMRVTEGTGRSKRKYDGS